MPRNLLAAALAALALAAGLTACGEKEETISTSTGSGTDGFAIAGEWTGELTQEGLPPFLVAVRIADPAAEGDSQVAYTGINCGGTWTFDGRGTSEPAVYTFTEQITQGAGGNCKGNGTVTLTANADAPQKLAYAFSGGGVQSSGTLQKTDAAGIAPVFAQAGVPLNL